MSGEKNNNYPQFEQVKQIKGSLMAFLAFFAAGLFIIALSILIGSFQNLGMMSAILFVIGIGVTALPCIMTLVFKTGGIFVNAGPIFSTSESRIGNVIYKTLYRDYNAQAALSIGFTLIKLVVCYFLSLILNPIITIAIYINYRIKRSKAKNFAEESGINPGEIPHINPLPVLITAGIVLAAFIAAIITQNVKNAEFKEEQKEHDASYSAVFEEIKSSRVPQEYYADACRIIGSDTVSMGGYIAEFSVNGTKVYSGKTSSSIEKEYVGISTGTPYFIIDNTLYTDENQTDDWQIVTDQDTIQYLLSRHISEMIGSDAEYLDGVFYDSDNPGDINYITYSYHDHHYSIRLDKENNITAFVYSDTDRLNTDELLFVLDDTYSLSELKEAAKKLI